MNIVHLFNEKPLYLVVFFVIKIEFNITNKKLTI